MIIKIKRLHKDAVIPTYATKEAACFDLHAIEDGLIHLNEATTFRTGLAFEIPEGYAMMIYPRSGLAFKYGVRLSNNVAVIDADFRGQVLLRLHNEGDCEVVRIKKGDRIAQARIEKSQKIQFEEVEELGQTDRGIGGLGSTGL